VEASTSGRAALLSFKINFFDTKIRKEYHARLMIGQVVIDSAEFARRGRRLEGEFAVRELSRLHDQLASTDGIVHYVLEGGLTGRREPQIECTINGLVHLVCQRCLGALEQDISAHSRLVLVENENLLPTPEEEDDSADYVVADPALDVAALVEDEVLLALPIAPKHEQGQCVDRPADAGAGNSEKSPFAALARLRPQGRD
jgi:uncharacterized protein